jgi:hypothetical protein
MLRLNFPFALKQSEANQVAVASTDKVLFSQQALLPKA